MCWEAGVVLVPSPDWSHPCIPGSGTGASPWPAARTAVVVSLGRSRISLTKPPHRFPWLHGSGKTGEEVQSNAGRGSGKEQDTGDVAWAAASVTPVPLGLRGEAEEVAAPEPRHSHGHSREWGGSRGSPWGPDPSVDGLVLRVASPPRQQHQAAAQQQHGQGRAQCHGRDGDDQGREGVPGGLPEAQQHRPAGGHGASQGRDGDGL